MTPQTPDSSDVIIIIVTFNRLECLKRCIRAIQTQTYTPLKIIIVDNASTDGTTPFLESLASQNHRMVHLKLPQNSGGAGGFHEGMRYALDHFTGWLWLMDDDAVPEPDALEKMYEIDRDFGNIYGSLTISEEEGDDELCWPAKTIDDNGGKNRLTRAHHITRPTKVSSIPFLGFCIHTSLIHTIGLPESGFFISGDDTEYCIRASQTGAEIYLVPESLIKHPLPERIDIHVFGQTVSLLLISAWKRYYDTRNRFLIARKYHGIKIWTQTLPGTLLRWICSIILQKGRWDQSRAFLQGTIDGLLNRDGIRFPPPQ